MKKLCECGCGGYASPGKRFIKGHNMRGKKVSEETIQKQKQKQKETKRINKEIREGKRSAPELPFCACGCGGRVTKPGNKYIYGHNRRGKYLTQEHKQKIGESVSGEKNGMYGKYQTKEARQKMSNNHPDISGEKNPMFGKEPWNKGETKETNESIKKNGEKGSKTRKEFFQTEEGQKHIEEHLSGKNNPMYDRHLIGEKNPNWQEGISFEPYCIKFNAEFKERVRDFFGRCCYVCGKNEIENGRKLDVHHVNYNKMVCCNDVKPLFVPLCQSCHSKTLKDRKYWEEFFTVSLEYLTDGECFLPKKCITKENGNEQNE